MKKYEITNKKLKKLALKKAEELDMSLERLVWNYINRGLMADNCNEDVFSEMHSQENLKKINNALGIDDL